LFALPPPENQMTFSAIVKLCLVKLSTFFARLGDRTLLLTNAGQRMRVVCPVLFVLAISGWVRHVSAQGITNGSFESGLTGWDVYEFGNSGSSTVIAAAIPHWDWPEGGWLNPTDGNQFALLYGETGPGEFWPASAYMSQQFSANSGQWLVFDYSGAWKGTGSETSFGIGVYNSSQGANLVWGDRNHYDNSRGHWVRTSYRIPVSDNWQLFASAHADYHSGDRAILCLDRVHLADPGSEQAAPILPTSQHDGQWDFEGVVRQQWIDPAIAEGFTYSAAGDTLFTQVGLPVGLGDTDGMYTITDGVNGRVVVPAGAFYSFATPVSKFTITGISPLVDGSITDSFPAFVDFNQPSANITMVPINVPDWQGGNVADPTNWDLAANWSPDSSVPNGPGSYVAFGNQPAANSVVDMVSHGQTVGAISFAATTTTTILSSGDFSLILDGNGVMSTIDVSGLHLIWAPVELANDAVISGVGTLYLIGGVSGDFELTVRADINASSIEVDSLVIGGDGMLTAVPEPSVIGLLLSAFFGSLLWWRRQSKSLRPESPDGSWETPCARASTHTALFCDRQECLSS
jgi:hypothetical protein